MQSPRTATTGFEATGFRTQGLFCWSNDEQKRGLPMSAATASVLTVEDDPIVRADLRLVLEDAGFSVRGAGDGIEAIELAREHQPDVILLDLGLPRLGGVETTRRILAERDVPIVALTGRSRRLAEEAIDAGAHSYVLKPFGEDEVVGKLFEALAARESRAESRRSIETLLELMGYPQDWAVDLERQAYRRGVVWREVER
jgi:CheY-like chemotaxis protein